MLKEKILISFQQMSCEASTVSYVISAAWFCLAAIGMYAFHRYQNNMIMTCFLTHASPVACKLIDVIAENERIRMGASSVKRNTLHAER